MKPTIMFVDDEVNVIQGLRRSLHAMRGEWDMIFANGGREALSRLDDYRVDVVVSDMRMPIMDGAELLSEIEKRDPRIIRMILSGQTDYEGAIRLAGICHQFLSKPCDGDTLVKRLRRALSLRDVMANEQLQAFIGGMHDLPTPSDTYHRIEVEMRNPNSSIARIAELVSGDMGLSAKLLQVSSSGYFGARGRVSSIEKAMALLGFERISSLVLSHGVTSQYRGCATGGVSLDAFNRHGISCANLAQSIADAEGMGQEVKEAAFVAGLLHDIGTLVLSVNKPEQYEVIHASTESEGRKQLAAEEETFGSTHPMIGAYLLGLWGLPYDIVEAIAYHHTPGGCQSGCFDLLTVVHAAEALLQWHYSEDGDQAFGDAVDAGYLKAAGVSDRVPAWGELLVEQAKKADST